MVNRSPDHDDLIQRQFRIVICEYDLNIEQWAACRYECRLVIEIEAEAEWTAGFRVERVPRWVSAESLPADWGSFNILRFVRGPEAISASASGFITAVASATFSAEILVVLNGP